MLCQQCIDRSESSWWKGFIRAGLATTAVFVALPAIGFGVSGIVRGSLIAWLQSVGAKGGFSMLWRTCISAAVGGLEWWKSRCERCGRVFV